MSWLFGSYYWVVTGRHNPFYLPTFQTAPELWSIWSIFFALLIPWAFWASTGHQTNKQGYKALIAKIIRHWYINLFWLHFSLINIFASISWPMMRQWLANLLLSLLQCSQISLWQLCWIASGFSLIASCYTGRVTLTINCHWLYLYLCLNLYLYLNLNLYLTVVASLWLPLARHSHLAYKFAYRSQRSLS